MATQGDFERARNYEFYRKEFIEGIDLGKAGKYVKKVNYIPNRVVSSLEGVPAAMQTCVPLRTFFGYSKGKSTIEIFERAFSPKIHLLLDDFLSTLIDHEILGHAKLAYEGRNPILQQEIEVLHQQIERMKERNCSEKYKNQTLNELGELLSGVRKLG